MTTVKDLAKLGEDARIEIIGEHARSRLVGVLLERNEPEKIARYIAKVTEQFPDVRHIDTAPGPTADVMLVRFGPVAVQ